MQLLGERRGHHPVRPRQLAPPVEDRHRQDDVDRDERVDQEEHARQIPAGGMPAKPPRRRPASERDADQIDRQHRRENVRGRLQQRADDPEPHHLVTDGEKAGGQDDGGGQPRRERGAGRRSDGRCGNRFSGLSEPGGDQHGDGDQRVDGAGDDHRRSQAVERDQPIGANQRADGGAERVDGVQARQRDTEVVIDDVGDLHHHRQRHPHQHGRQRDQRRDDGKALGIARARQGRRHRGQHVHAERAHHRQCGLEHDIHGDAPSAQALGKPAAGVGPDTQSKQEHRYDDAGGNGADTVIEREGALPDDLVNQRREAGQEEDEVERPDKQRSAHRQNAV
jgi:hypothetical protein